MTTCESELLPGPQHMLATTEYERGCLSPKKDYQEIYFLNSACFLWRFQAPGKVTAQYPVLFLIDFPDMDCLGQEQHRISLTWPPLLQLLLYISFLPHGNTRVTYFYWLLLIFSIGTFNYIFLNISKSLNKSSLPWNALTVKCLIVTSTVP